MTTPAPEHLSPQVERRAITLIYTAAFSYLIALGMMHVLVPLYALSLGYDLARLGIIVASHAVFGLGLRLFIGALSDQLGERRALRFCFATMILGAVVFVTSGMFWVLITAQLFVGLSRATYWTATQSYASRINPARAGEALGRLSGAGHAGTIIGTFLSGVLAATVGYQVAFTVAAAITAAGLVGTLGLPVLPKKTTQPNFREALAPVTAFLRSRGMYLAGLIAFLGSVSWGINMVLFIPYFTQIGYNETAVGALRTATSVGSLVTGIFFGAILARMGQRAMYTGSLLLVGVTILAVPFVADSVYILALLMFWNGLVHSFLGIGYTVLATEFSPPEQRGMAMAYVGLYWGAAQLVVPAALGVMATAIDIVPSIWVAAGFHIAIGLALPFCFAVLRSEQKAVTQVEPKHH